MKEYYICEVSLKCSALSSCTAAKPSRHVINTSLSQTCGLTLASAVFVFNLMLIDAEPRSLSLWWNITAVIPGTQIWGRDEGCSGLSSFSRRGASHDITSSSCFFTWLQRIKSIKPTANNEQQRFTWPQRETHTLHDSLKDFFFRGTK